MKAEQNSKDNIEILAFGFQSIIVNGMIKHFQRFKDAIDSANMLKATIEIIKLIESCIVYLQ